MRKCPRCLGDGDLPVFGNHPDGLKLRPCELCKGQGEVTPEIEGRYLAGRALRDARVEREVSLRDEAKRLGITAVELAEVERGLRDAPYRIPDATPGIRDVDAPCTMFEPGEPGELRDCRGDGHYICRECLNMSAEEVRLQDEEYDG